MTKFLKFSKPDNLLNFDNNAKTVKGQKSGYKTGILYLAPYKTSGFNVCPMASKGCIKACLNTAGQGIYPIVQTSRINKTRWYMQERDTFLARLRKEISLFVKRCEKENFIPCLRLNGTSDIPFEVTGIMEEFPNVQFYDYTKIYKRIIKYTLGLMPKNYYLVYSVNEDNEAQAFKVLKSGVNVAMVFLNQLPKTYKGYKVIDADKNDLRFTDPKNVICGLVAKGRARKDESGFVKNWKEIFSKLEPVTRS